MPGVTQIFRPSIPVTPRLSRLRSTACALLYIFLDPKSARGARDSFTQYLRSVILTLEDIQRSLINAEDTERIQDLTRRLSIILERLSDRSWTGRIIATCLLETSRYDSIRSEIDTTLSLIELRSVTSLQGRMDQLFSIVERETHHGGNNQGAISVCMDRPVSGANAPRIDYICGLRKLTLGQSWPPCDQPVDNGAPAPGPPNRPPLNNKRIESATEGMVDYSRALAAAFRNVEHHRLLVQTTGDHRVCLANSLCLLADLLQQTGRIREAVAFQQEATDIYLECREGVLGARPLPGADHSAGESGNSAIDGCNERRAIGEEGESDPS